MEGLERIRQNVYKIKSKIFETYMLGSVEMPRMYTLQKILEFKQISVNNGTITTVLKSLSFQRKCVTKTGIYINAKCKMDII